MPLSTFNRIGGCQAIEQIVERFYDRISNDKRVGHFFNDVERELQINKQKAFFAGALSSPKNHDRKHLAERHSHLVQRGMNDNHVDIFIHHLAESMHEIKVSTDLISDVLVICESMRDDVLGRSKSTQLTTS